MTQETTFSLLHQYYRDAENGVPQTIEINFCDLQRHVQCTLKEMPISGLTDAIQVLGW